MSIPLWSFGSGHLPLSLRDDADWRERARDQVIVAAAEGRGALTWSSYVPASFCCPIRGRARIAGRDLTAEVGAGEIYVAEPGSRLTVQPAGTADASLLGVLLPAGLVADIARSLGLAGEEPMLFPALVRSDAALNVPLLHLAHLALRRVDDCNLADRLVHELVTALLRRQSEYEPLIGRCPGRSMRYRRQLFVRLLRAKNYIESSVTLDATLARLAEVAKLSPTHFLRLYRDVFGQTPHKHVTQTRLVAARELLSSSELGVSEVCRTLGFENRCAFARVFKQHFGTTPSSVRQLRSAPKSKALEEGHRRPATPYMRLF